MIQISPSILNAFQDMHNDDCPWMDATKFAAQILNHEPMSDAADAGNAVHEAAFDHNLLEFKGGEALAVTNTDGNTWWVDPALVLEIRRHTPDWGKGIAEVPFLITEQMLGIPGVQLSMRADYLTRGWTDELKTSARIRSQKYIDSAQRYAYLVAYKQPLNFLLSQVKITRPRGRPDNIKGSIALEHVTSYKIQPNSNDLPFLRDLTERCLAFLKKDPLLIAHVSQKTPPALL